MTRRYLRFFVVFLPIQMVVSSAVSVAQPSPEVTPDSAYDCDITEPNSLMPAGTPDSNPADWYGSGSADPSLWLYAVPNGPISPYPEFEPRDEGGHRIKSPFWRSEGSGPIMLTGERLDAPSEHDPHVEGAWGSYPIPGMLATGIWYPTEGCRELTATDGNDTLTWTVLVRSSFASCPVTSAIDDGDTIPENVIPVASDHYYGENGLYVALGAPDRHLRNYPLDSVLVSKKGAIFDTFV